MAGRTTPFPLQPEWHAGLWLEHHPAAGTPKPMDGHFGGIETLKLGTFSKSTLCDTATSERTRSGANPYTFPAHQPGITDPGLQTRD